MEIWKRKVEDNGKFETYYNPANGTLIQRVSDEIEDDNLKFPSPNLCDLKITDFCDLGCKFCYQGSTKAGKGPDEALIAQLPKALYDLGVFEVAIGGGEPTQWEGLKDLMLEFRSNHIVPNFTTKNYQLIQTPEFIPYLKNAGAFAVSIHNVKILKKLGPHLKEAQKHCKVHLQVVVGVVDTNMLRDIVQEFVRLGLDCLTLLGFKEVGFGSTYSKRKDCDWHEAIGDASRIAVDSALAAQYPEILSKYPTTLWGSTEGGSNIYIDAIEGTCAPSSYYTEKEGKFSLLNQTNLSEHLKAVWPNIPVVG